MEKAIIYYLVLINILAVLLAIIDKLAAVRGKRRIPERTLLLAAAAGGSLGLCISMQVFRHKTRHAKFYIGVPLIMSVQLLLAWLIYRGF